MSEIRIIKDQYTGLLETETHGVCIPMNDYFFGLFVLSSFVVYLLWVEQNYLGTQVYEGDIVA
jgi:hypothetical protein